jgi:hypothetical protein
LDRSTHVLRWPRSAPVAIAVVTAATTTAYLAMGAGFVLDDWWVLRNAHFDGTWGAEGTGPAAARPAARLVYAVMAGGFGRHPLPAIASMALLNVASALLAYGLLARVVPRRVAATAAVLWVWLPNHTSLEYWMTCSIIGASQLAALAGIAAGMRDRRRPIDLAASGGLLLFSGLCYEATIPVAALAVVGLPWLAHRRLDWTWIGVSAASLGGASLWVLTHWFPGKEVQPFADLGQLVPANLGWGVVGHGLLGDALVVACLAGITVALSRLLLPSFRGAAGAGERAVAIGLVVMVAGVLPFVRYFYAPLGAGDRANHLSSLGGALVLAGLLAMVLRVDRRIALGAALVVVVAAGVTRVDRMSTWSTAGRDADAILAGVRAAYPEPPRRIVIGPEPVQQDNVAAFLDHSNFDGAVQLLYGTREVRGFVSQSLTQFEQVAENERFDIRDVSELDPRSAGGDPLVR